MHMLVRMTTLAFKIEGEPAKLNIAPMLMKYKIMLTIEMINCACPLESADVAAVTMFTTPMMK